MRSLPTTLLLLLACFSAGTSLAVRDLPLFSTLISSDLDGGEGDSRSDYPAVSSGARWVAFDSESTDLVPGDANGVKDVFLRDTSTGVTTRISVSSAGEEGNGPSFAPEISDDGRYVVFESMASNFAVDDQPRTIDVFLHDLASGETALVSADGQGRPSGGSSAELSGDGRRAVYLDRNDLAWSWDRATGQREVVSVDPSGQALRTRFASISSKPHLVAFEAPNSDGIYLRDITGGCTRMIAHPGAVGHFTPVLSSDGSGLVFLAANFSSDPASWLEGAHFGPIDLVHVDLTEGTTRVLARSVDGYERASLSADGRYASFVAMGALGMPASMEAPLLAVYRWDTQTGAVIPMVIGPHGVPEGVPSAFTALTPEGDRVAYAHLDAEEYGLGFASFAVGLAGRILLDAEMELYQLRVQVWLSPQV